MAQAPMLGRKLGSPALAVPLEEALPNLGRVLGVLPCELGDRAGPGPGSWPLSST